MGIYLFILAGYDTIFRNDYVVYALLYLWSWNCQTTGIIGMIASEVSVIILACMSLDRWIKIVYPFSNFSKSLTITRCMILLCCIWVTWCILAGIPVPLYGTADFYGSSEVCFPLHLQYPFSNGWIYSFVIFVVVNSLAMMAMAISYISIYHARIKSLKNVQSTQGPEVNRVLLRRLLIIVLTDAACWIPIISLKILAIGGICISPTAHGWVSVFVLPINSALNPLIYTVITPTSTKWIKDKCSTCSASI
jgi:hypothetical protein